MFIEVATRPLQAMSCIQFISSINKLLFILSFAAMYNFLKITNIKWHKKKYAFAQIILFLENIRPPLHFCPEENKNLILDS